MTDPSQACNAAHLLKVESTQHLIPETHITRGEVASSTSNRARVVVDIVAMPEIGRGACLSSQQRSCPCWTELPEPRIRAHHKFGDHCVLCWSPETFWCCVEGHALGWDASRCSSEAAAARRHLHAWGCGRGGRSAGSRGIVWEGRLQGLVVIDLSKGRDASP